MPKLDDTHTVDRLRKRIAELEAGKEVSAKDLKAVLTEAQWEAMEDAWEHQRKLREAKQARDEQEKKAVGWKTKREVRLEILKAALDVAKAGSSKAWKKKLDKAAVRQGRIYFKEYGKARDAGKDVQTAKNIANNALTRAGLRRLDGQEVRSFSKRDKEVREMEARLRKMGGTKEDEEG